MGVIQRFKDIMSANINAMLDKAENPEKMIDQYMRNLEDDLGKVKAETASVMAEEARAKRAYDEALAEVDHVAFADQHAALVFGGEFVHNGSDRAARTAPLGPEVDDDGELR